MQDHDRGLTYFWCTFIAVAMVVIGIMMYHGITIYHDSHYFKFPNELVELDYYNHQATLTPEQWTRKQSLGNYQETLDALKQAQKIYTPEESFRKLCEAPVGFGHKPLEH